MIQVVRHMRCRTGGMVQEKTVCTPQYRHCPVNGARKNQRVPSHVPSDRFIEDDTHCKRANSDMFRCAKPKDKTGNICAACVIMSLSCGSQKRLRSHC